jgi:hypothetical protein
LFFGAADLSDFVAFSLAANSCFSLSAIALARISFAMDFAIRCPDLQAYALSHQRSLSGARDHNEQADQIAP